MAGDNLVGLVGFRQVHILNDAKIRGFNGERTLDVITNHHVGRHVLPLIDCLPKGGLPLASPRMSGLQGQLVIDVHFMPRNLVDPHHGPHGLEIIEAAPESCLLLMHWQGGNPGNIGDQPSQYLFFRWAEVDG